MNASRFGQPTAKGILLVCFGLLLLPPSVQADPQLYRAVRNSALEFQPDAPTGPDGPFRVEGTFGMTPQISPLDWDYFRISDLRLEVLTGEAQPAVMRGHGSFRRSGRFNHLRMELDVQFGEVALHLDSGDQPAEPWGPDLDLVLKGAAAGGTKAGTYVLRLAAVPELARWRYRLIEGSTLTDDCGPCGRPTITMPLRGAFDLVLVEENPLFSRYHLFAVRFQSGMDYQLEGEGEYEVGGEVVVRQDLRLEVDVLGAIGGPRITTLETTPGPTTRRWPMWSVDVRETKAPPLSQLSLELRAAPFHELWFSTAHGMTPGNQPGLEPRISGGDGLADTGRRVKTNAALLAPLGWESVKEPLLIDALTVAPGGEIWFSFIEAQLSPKLGAIGDGDLVSDRGRVVRRNADLIAPFGLMPPVPDLGLDGVQALEDGELLFSITRGAFSERLGQRLRPGDILSNRGEVRHSVEQLLFLFSPNDPLADPGLDAFYVWPSGEVWFSTETSFETKTAGWIMDGALLSDQGYVVAENLELVGAFQPLEDLANFGLDGLFVVTDTLPTAPPAQLSLSFGDQADHTVRLSWRTQARVFQVEKTVDPRDPFVALSPIVPALEWVELLPAPPPPAGYYRLRQW